MKTFEEKFTAWLDGTLSEEELRSFEQEHPSIQREQAQFLKLKKLLKDNLGGRELANPDFFNSQIMLQIDREKAKSAHRSSSRTLLGLPRLAWGGLFALGVGFALFFTLIPRGNLADPRAGYVAEVLKTKTADKVKATVDNQKDMTIIKLEGLDKLPSDPDLKH
jgi:hypothetical protein